MSNYTSIDWKMFTIRIVEALRWPIVFAFAFFLVREPMSRLIVAIAAKLSI